MSPVALRRTAAPREETSLRLKPGTVGRMGQRWRRWEGNHSESDWLLAPGGGSNMNIMNIVGLITGEGGKDEEADSGCGSHPGSCEQWSCESGGEKERCEQLGCEQLGCEQLGCEQHSDGRQPWPAYKVECKRKVINHTAAPVQGTPRVPECYARMV